MAKGRKFKDIYSINFRKRWWEVMAGQPDEVRVVIYDNLMSLLFDGSTQTLDGEAGIIWALISENIEEDIKANERKPKIKEGVPFEKRRKAFVESLSEYVKTYGPDMMNSFYRYWSQKTAVGEHMLWEVQPAFELDKRVAMWAKRGNVQKLEQPKQTEQAVSGIDSIRRAMSNG